MFLLSYGPSIFFYAWGLPRSASEIAANIDLVFYKTLFVALFTFVSVIASMAFVIWRSQKKEMTERKKGFYLLTHQYFLAVVFFSFIVAMGWLFISGMKAWLPLTVVPPDALEIDVRAKKWQWQFSYPRQSISHSVELCVPVGTTVKLVMTSSDIIHNFFLPAFRIKRDIFPHHRTVLWFKAARKGTFDILSARSSDNGENLMYSKLKVLSAEAFRRWVALHSNLDGKDLFVRYGCHVCHSINGKRLVGPSLKGIYGTMRLVSLGPQGKRLKLKMDDNYIKTSILDPNKHIVVSYYPVMPSFRGRITRREIDLIIRYIKKLRPSTSPTTRKEIRKSYVHKKR